MLKIKTAADYKRIKNSVVTIGTFDGVHVGHQKIINRLVHIAETNKLQALVLTFFPHPRMVVQKDSSIKLINTIDEKAAQLQQLGVDHLVLKEFTKTFSRLSALEYVRDVLVNKLKVKHIIVGYDHHFGRNRTATIEDLIEFGKFYGFEVTQIDAQEVGDVAVSSTKIRAALREGNMRVANDFLGYNFMLTGTVVKGKGLGANLSFPTANIFIEEPYKLIPKQGVYLVQSKIENQLVYGMMNIGKNPTVSQDNKTHIEVHFFNLDANLYTKTLKIELLEHLRSEIKFPNIEALKVQLEKDKALAQQRIDLLLKI
ncbi:bifunctional riboflavin kinase/FAD synthetase [Flavobacteriaceae bacterium]|nr:bifunctional riboflavin kinase/FAD synthetase [Formosa sp. Hel3_A1_48]MDC0950719.1 bifunctional riboflavin kinase/FAD synthetase [Flavobacteriaceae bacterium]MDG1672525.1 bifunctional riboflavin kinase/FAD synthetase [Flavobacteriaceae bacterium]MDG2484908.1 bifunctional riboflavin kinase/FAD synthetase [Flavobacteriaceae bacterium]